MSKIKKKFNIGIRNILYEKIATIILSRLVQDKIVSEKIVGDYFDKVITEAGLK